VYNGLEPKETRALKGTERRQFKRIPVLRPVMYRDERYGETKSKILDLSIGGAYIESPVLPQGSEIELEFELINGHMVRVTAIVRYIVLGTGMGVEFQRLSDEDRVQINDFIERF
jgi:PilZ domain-containing protein